MLSELAPGFLVAAPGLLDPNFKRTVVLMATHQPEGSLGFVINRPARIRFSQVVDELEAATVDVPVPDVPVWAGGPVSPETGWLMFDPRLSPVRAPRDNLLEVTPGIHISTSREMLARVARAAVDGRHALVLGYAGWGAGQLDLEIQQGSWIPVDLDESVLYETPLDERWDAALGVLGIDPRQLVGQPSGAS